MKKNIIIACLAIFVLSSCQGLTQKAFKVASDQFNKQCPMKIDDYTRMDSTRYVGADNSFCYFYSLILEVEDSTVVANLHAELEKNLPTILKKTDEMKVYKEADVTLVYTYFSDTTKEKLFEIKIPAEKY